MTEEQLLHHLALTMLPHIGDMHIGLLLSKIPDPASIFKSNTKMLESIPGIGTVRARSITQFRDFDKAIEEIRFAKDNGIHILVKGNEGYPTRLDHCVDSPHVLFYKGSAHLNQERVLSVIGTRSPTHYGSDRVRELIDSISGHGVVVVSGLAYGIDTMAHKACVKNRVETIGVLGHGLDRIYPFLNRELATQMVECGGLLTEFWRGTKPERQHFPLRNRIVAGMADAVVVIESGEKGGSLITAGIANSYNKDVLAYPGRAIDAMSLGCNKLIRQNQAALINSGTELLEFMNWEVQEKRPKVVQSRLFPDLSAEEQGVMDQLYSHGSLHIDQLIQFCHANPSSMAVLLLSLEMNGLIESLPGRKYVALGPKI